MNIHLYIHLYIYFQTNLNLIDERFSDEKVDTRLLATKLENENFDDEKANYVVKINYII